MKELLGLVSSFPEHYDETSMFTGGRQAQVYTLALVFSLSQCCHNTRNNAG